jgi:quinol monooxygenase YgiN
MTHEEPVQATRHREYTAVWRYRVKPAKSADFIRAYGAEGIWVDLFRKAEGYLSTELVQDHADSAVFVTIDRWESRASYDAFRKRFADEYLSIDTRCAAYTEDEERLAEGVRP